MAKQVRGNRNFKLKSQKVRGNKPVILSTKSKTLMKKRPVKAIGGSVQDARQKILQKKRKTVVDARDVLAKIAKTQDARSKLDKLRNGSVRDRIAPKAIPSNPKVKASRPQMKRSPPKKAIVKPSVPIRKTIVNDMDYAMPSVEPAQQYNSPLYKWVKPDLRPASHIIGSLEPTRQAMRDVMREELLLARNTWPNFITPKPTRLQPSGYVDLDAVEEDEEMPYSHASASRITLQGSTRISNVHSRLDSVPNEPRSHGILSQTKTKVVVPAGHRIVVSNLQPSVTEDDIKELFEDIGQLLSAKLVRPGVAEVIYKNLKDAQKAVDTYHNRQLDGQPMKCLLVNKRPLNQPTGAPLTKNEGIMGRRPTSLDSSNKLIPDISTIHKVLFQRK
ncbi:hypothetical protein GWI33_015491 [Rhynchophorus ferrugineus]|uniref:RRM domain-containing protein n=1 Tax=Rhynchophorus ferrugineus TaxID=354439 RepID=A0A834I373_RHYFE|nr:hypothetical protein GWI33_015491 [Rhynchophorus ferrugineus]